LVVSDGGTFGRQPYCWPRDLIEKLEPTGRTSTMQIIDDWLEDWLSAALIRRLTLEAASGPADNMTAQLSHDALADGYDLDQLQDACDGNIRHFLERHRARLPAAIPAERMAGSGPGLILAASA
jgi:hypothetical protein